MSTDYRLSTAAPLALHHTVRAPPPVRARRHNAPMTPISSRNTRRTVPPHRLTALPIIGALSTWVLHAASQALKSP